MLRNMKTKPNQIFYNFLKLNILTSFLSIRQPPFDQKSLLCAYDISDKLNPSMHNEGTLQVSFGYYESLILEERRVERMKEAEC